MFVTLFGIVISFKLMHPLNAELPIAIMLFDNVTDCKYEHPSKAFESMYLTELGISTSVMCLFYDNVLMFIFRKCPNIKYNIKYYDIIPLWRY